MRGSQPPVVHEEQRQAIAMACRVLAGRGLGLQVGEGVVLVGVAVRPRQQHPRLAQAARTLPLEQRDLK